MDLTVRQEPTGTGTRRVLDLNNIQDRERRSLSAFFEMVGEHDLPPPQLLDGFVFGIIFYAMRLGQGIRVHGAMSLDALRNLNEFQEAWTLWKGDRYRKVDIIPDELVESPAVSPTPEALAAFSGGIDSIFTVLRHANGKLGTASYPLKRSLVMVHGFDVPLNDHYQLDSLRKRVQPFVDEMNLSLRLIRTNLKKLELQVWQDSFTAQLACCLHNYSHECGYGLIGSSEPYDGLVLPWGSNPATDYLLSGAAFRIVHDGAGYSRTRKVEEIIKNSTAAAVAKVCWEGTETHKNCGVCEKCIRTQLNFLAAGESMPACFDVPLDTRKIKTIKLRGAAECAELASIASYARSKGIQAKWIGDLEKRVKRYARQTKWQHLAADFRSAWSLTKQLKFGEIIQKAATARRRPNL